ncbi:MAG: SgcJ/EcaC family oxidoreductase [Nitrospiraceae bacterium]|nr:SgcJ/EcaC family oxidoreductase [Nitrospiraceae bacterium]
MHSTAPDQLHRAFTQAFNSGDLDAVMRLYEPEAALVPQPGQITIGAAANRQALEQFMALKGRMTISTVYVVQTEDLALLRGDWHLTAKAADGQPIEMRGQNIEVARRQADGRWLFVIDHPFGAG